VHHIEEAEIELVAVVGHFHRELLEAGVFNALAELRPEVGGANTLAALTGL